MIRVCCLVACLALAFVCARSPAANLIVNGGFETGTFAGWTRHGAASGSLFDVVVFPHSGSFSARFGATSGQPDRIRQSFPTAAGRRYTVSFWVYNSGADGDLLLVEWNSANLLSSGPGSIPTDAWTQLRYTVLAVSNTSELSLSVYDGPSFIYLDDVSVETDNLIANPSFETGGFTGWNILAGGSSDFGVTTVPHTGTYGAFFAALGATYDQVWQTVPTAPGRVYMLQFWVINSTYGSDSLRVFWEGNLIFDGTSCPLANGWAPLTFFVTSTGALSEVRFAVHDGPSSIYIDDVYLGQPDNPGCRQSGDADGNGVVAFADLTKVLENWNTMCVP